MRKPTICICETKAQTSFAVTAKLISVFVFATRIVKDCVFLNPKFQAFSLFQRLYRPVVSDLIGNPNCWFSQAQAKLYEVACVDICLSWIFEFDSTESWGQLFKTSLA